MSSPGWPEVPEWLLAGSRPPKPPPGLPPELPPGLPPGFKPVLLRPVLTAMQTLEVMKPKLKDPQNSTFVIVKWLREDTYFQMTRANEKCNIFIVALPYPCPVLLLLGKEPNTGKPVQKLVICLETDDDQDPDWYTITMLAEQHGPCDLELMWGPRCPVTLYTRVELKPSLFQMAGFNDTVQRLMVRVGEKLLGVPENVEFMLVAFSDEKVLIAVLPGQEIHEHIGKPEKWPVVFEVNNSEWSRKTGVQSDPTIMTYWTISDYATFKGDKHSVRLNVDYQPSGDMLQKALRLPDSHREQQFTIVYQLHLLMIAFSEWRVWSRKTCTTQYGKWTHFLTKLQLSKKELQAAIFYENVIVPNLLSMALEAMRKQVLQTKRKAWAKKTWKWKLFVKKSLLSWYRASSLPELFSQMELQSKRWKVMSAKRAYQLRKERKNPMMREHLWNRHILRSKWEKVVLAMQDRQPFLLAVDRWKALALQRTELLKQYKRLRSQLGAPAVACSICLESLPNIVLQPCLHQCMCNDCFLTAAADRQQCPICRQEVTGHVQTFLSQVA